MNLIFSKLQANASLIFTVGVVGLLMLMVLPIPTFVLDGLLALNITLGMTVLVVPYIKEPLEFSSFRQCYSLRAISPHTQYCINPPDSDQGCRRTGQPVRLSRLW